MGEFASLLYCCICIFSFPADTTTYHISSYTTMTSVVDIKGAVHYEKNLSKTLDFANIHYYLVNVLKFTKYLVNVPKFTKYLVNSYHQKGVKHYVRTN